MAFIGENAGELQQVYEVDCETKVLTRLTNHTTNVVAYAFAKNDAEKLFLAERPVEPIFDNRAGKDAVIVSSEPLADLLAGRDRRYARQFADLFVIAKTAPGEISVKTRTDLVPGNLWLSPNGRFRLRSPAFEQSQNSGKAIKTSGFNRVFVRLHYMATRSWCFSIG